MLQIYILIIIKQSILQYFFIIIFLWTMTGERCKQPLRTLLWTKSHFVHKMRTTSKMRKCRFTLRLRKLSAKLSAEKNILWTCLRTLKPSVHRCLAHFVHSLQKKHIALRTRTRTRTRPRA